MTKPSVPPFDVHDLDEPSTEHVFVPPRGRRPWLHFDARDYELVGLVNEFRTLGESKRPKQLRKLFDPALHPRGIKELAASQAERISYAVIRLLGSLESGDAQDRIMALRALHEEVLRGGQGALQRNTARVLLAIMKELVRVRGDYWRQVELAHDFYRAVSGRPSVIRRQLRKYHLLEMAEQWNQVAFDQHVHDANTKGRKAPTHLIMDAWIKGIRELTVVYYNYITPEAFAELSEAAAIMEITVRAGVEVSARFRGKYVQFIWVPPGLEQLKDFLAFLERPAVRAFFDKGREVAKLQEKYALALLASFNNNHLARLNERYGLALGPLAAEEFLEFVGVGQPSVAHLADFIHHKCLEDIQPRLDELRARHRQGDAAEQRMVEEQLALLDRLIPEEIIDCCLKRSLHPELADPKVPTEEDEVPELLRLSPEQLLEELQMLRAGSLVILNPSNLTPADVLELLYLSKGAITHIEIFNLKDYRRQKNPYVRQIAEIRRVLNTGSPITLKRLIREIIAEVEHSEEHEKKERLHKLHDILTDIQAFASMYAGAALHSHLGSDSIGRSHSLFGMGLAVEDTLLRRARREFKRHPGTRESIPVRTDTVLHTVWRPRESPIAPLDLMLRVLRRLPGLREFGYLRKDSYEVLPNATRFDEHGNIITLGGIEEKPGNNLQLEASPTNPPPFRWRLLNTRLKDVLKVLIGFVPAFLTFFLTKDWWVLAYLGGLIWFGITGLRNIIQSIVGGGGLSRSKLLTWRNLINWDRIADSLLYTGFSVPLLDWLVKTVLLDQGLGVNTTTAPVLLYSVMALANGSYLFSHNTFRGLPRAAAFGNFFRSLLSIPIAVGLNALLFALLRASGLGPFEANFVLQQWAAVIGKAASDIVAGFIEGTADRNFNVRTRMQDYTAKLALLIDVHGRLEALFPDADVLKLLESPKEFIRTIDHEAHDLEVRQIINALDLMYFWMLQPRARPVFTRLLGAATPEERLIILRTQRLLERQRPICELFLDNLVGKNFSLALAFYLEKSPIYLRDMRRFADEIAA